MGDSPVYVGPSNIPGGGRGVFIREGCEKDTPLMFYDGETKIGPLTLEEQEYALEDKEGTIVGYPFPINEMGVAQLVNDSCMPDIPETEPPEKTDLDETVRVLSGVLLLYLEESWKNENVNLRDDTLIFYSGRRMLAGEECYFHYGPLYWVERHLRMRKEGNVKNALLFIKRVLYVYTPREFYSPSTVGRVLADLVNDPGKYRPGT